MRKESLFQMSDVVYLENIFGEKFRLPKSELAVKLMLDYVKDTGIPAKISYE